MVQRQASDLHLKAGTPPIVRKQNALMLLSKDYPVLTPKDIQSAIVEILKPQQQVELAENKQVDFSYGVPNLGRFRFNVFYQRGTLRVVARNIPFNLPDFESLNLPSSIKHLTEKYQNGLILITGATGNGKSSTVVSILNHINQTQSRHILTVEDPIEFLIQDRKSLITQRELGVDSVSYDMALKSSLRQDPDIIFFGELRDRASAETALQAANTGHLVISTLHTNSVPETLNRILGLFDRGQENLIRMELASCLRAIICQKLIVKKDKTGFVPAIELLINNPRVRALLEDKTKSASLFYDVLESSKEGWGMQSLNQHLIELVSQGLITQEAALKASYSPEKLKLHFGGLSHNPRENPLLKPAPASENNDLPSMEDSFNKFINPQKKKKFFGKK